VEQIKKISKFPRASVPWMPIVSGRSSANVLL
jgi:hypothetical protein